MFKARSVHHMCCVLCCKKNSVYVLEFMLTNGHKVGELIENTPEPLQVALSTLTTDQRFQLQMASRILVEVHGPNEVPLVHRRYYQKESIMTRCTLGGLDVEMGEVELGTIVEIFQKNEKREEGNSVIENLKKDFVADVLGGPIYHNLPNVKNDSYVSICFATGVKEYGRLERGSFYTTTFKPGYWKDLSFELQVEALLASVER